MKKLVLYFLILFVSACKGGVNTNKADLHAPDKSGPVEEKEFLELGGEKQYVEITSASSDNPVLLFLHGGPGWPQTPQLRFFNSDLTKSLILVSWDQRGCGKSYMNNPHVENVSLQQILNDAHQLTQILKKKFKRNKIYLAGFSWGSIVGLKLVEEYPDDYLAYFAISQVIDLKKNIAISRAWIKEQADSAGDKTTLKILNQIEKGDTSICKGQLDCFLKQFEYLNKYHGAIFRNESEAAIEKSQVAYDDYKKYDWSAGFSYSAVHLEKDLFATNLSMIRELKIPVYFFVGRHDWNIPAETTVEFAEKLQTPKKEIVWFEHSGHEPLEEEADRFNKEIIARISSK